MSRRAAGRTGAEPRRHAEPSGAAGGKPGGLPQPDQAGVCGYTEGFYYKPRIDKQRSRSMRRAHWPEQLSQGRGGRRLSQSQERKALEAAASYRDILGRTTSSSRCSGTDRRAAAVNSGIPAIRRDLQLPMVCTNDVHYLRETDAHAHDILLCIGTAKMGSATPSRLRYDAKPVLPEDRRGNAEVFRISRTRSRTRCASRSAAA